MYKGYNYTCWDMENTVEHFCYGSSTVVYCIVSGIFFDSNGNKRFNSLCFLSASLESGDQDSVLRIEWHPLYHSHTYSTISLAKWWLWNIFWGSCKSHQDCQAQCNLWVLTFDAILQKSVGG